MDSKILSDVACGVFRLRKDDPHMFNSTVVDVHDDNYTTLTTVEVRSGTIVVHCLATLEAAEDEDGDESETEEGADDEETAKEEVEEEEESETPEGKSYTLSSGNSVTVRAMAVRLVPIGMETAEGVYQVQMMKAAG